MQSGNFAHVGHQVCAIRALLHGRILAPRHLQMKIERLIERYGRVGRKSRINGDGWVKCL